MSRDYRILVADNLPSEIESVSRELERLGADIEITRVDDASQALHMALHEYFHVAIIDLRWDKDFQVGAEILRRFRDRGSAGIRCMMTKYVGKSSELLALLKDTGRVADVLYDKQDQGSAQALLEIIESDLRRWRSREVRIDGLGDLIGAVSQMAGRLGLAEVSEESLSAELVDLVEDVFGGSLPELGEDQTVKVELALMGGGLSSAVLVEARPVLGRGDDGEPIVGNRCILKFDSTAGTRKEAGAYDRSVRFSVALDHRVEMLATFVRGRLGVICYSFAGGSQASVRQLDTVALAANGTLADEVEPVLRALFSLESKRWYDIIGPEESIRSFFHDKLNFSFKDASALLEGWARKLTKREGIHFDGARLVVGDCGLTLPAGDVFGSAVFTGPTRTCLIHGDLHGGNVMVSDEDRVSLIDFANTGLGPRYLDAATLQGSIRLWSSAESTGLRGQRRPQGDPHAVGRRLQRVLQLEQRLLSGRRQERAEPWMYLAAVLDEQMEENFGSGHDAERLATYAAQAVRLACHPTVSEFGRLRCLAWYTAIERQLRSLRLIVD